MGLDAHSACQVFGPTIPSAMRLFACWNCFTAASVLSPNIPSATPELNPLSASKFCSLVTSGPEESFFIV